MNESEAQRQYMFCLSDWPKLDLQVNKGTDFKAWCLRWKSYSSLFGLDKEEALQQVEAPSLSFLRETLGIVQNLGFTDTERKDVLTIINVLQRYVDDYLNKTMERWNFHHQLQVQ